MDAEIAWQDLVAAALLGTERKPFAPPSTPGALAALLDGLSGREPEKALLGTTAASVFSDARAVDRSRRPRLRSNRPICSAGISTSSSTRNMKTSQVRAAPTSPTPAIHQMCQIRAKPVITAKNAVTKPAGLFLGTPIGTYSCRCPATEAAWYGSPPPRKPSG